MPSILPCPGRSSPISISSSLALLVALFGCSGELGEGSSSEKTTPNEMGDGLPSGGGRLGEQAGGGRDSAALASGGAPGAAAGGSSIDGSNASTGGASHLLPKAQCVEMVEAAQAFLDGLSEQDARELHFSWHDAQRTQFEFLPPGNAPRDGLTLKELPEADLSRFDRFMSAVLSEPGKMKVEAIMDLEQLLGSPPYRDPENYFISLFGDPNTDSEQPWGFKLEGHHLSVHASIIACEKYSATPAFWGASPSLAPLSQEIAEANALYEMLDSDQKSAASSGSTSDQATLAKKTKATPSAEEGLPAADMSLSQRQQLRSLIGVWLGNMASPIAEDRWEGIEAAGIESIRFLMKGKNYRLQGPTFIIEFNYADDAHVHGIWRDFDGDYGEDLLQRHLDAQH